MKPRECPHEILVFVHIPKTAGTSFRTAAELSFGKEKVLYDYGEDNPTTSPIVTDTIYGGRPERLSSSIDGNGILFLAGHFSALKYRRILGERARLCTFFRDPLERVLSEYSHQQRYEGFTGTLEVFCEIPRFCDAQAKQVAGVSLSAFYFVGVTESYEASISAFNKRTGLDFADLHENIGRKGFEAKQAPSEKDVDLVLKRNQRDLRMYAEAKSLLSGSIDS